MFGIMFNHIVKCSMPQYRKPGLEDPAQINCSYKFLLMSELIYLCRVIYIGSYAWANLSIDSRKSCCDARQESEKR